MLKNDSKYFLFSLLLHLTVICLLFETSNQLINDSNQIEISAIVDGVQGENKSSQEDNFSIIIPKGDTEIAEENLDEGYFGIGITTQDHFVNGIFVVEVITVSSGYPADLAGIGVGDKIIEVNGKLITTGQEIRGNKKDSLVLKVIKKNGSVVSIRLTRDFIRTKY